MADRVATSVRAERRAVAGALAAELGHDLQGPLNLFRLTTERLARGEALDQEDVSLLQEELGRLSQLNARLRELARTPIQRGAVSARDLIAMAMTGRQLPYELEVDATDAVSVRCDPRLLSHALRELIDNAVEARAQHAGVRFQDGPAPGFCVWDDGDGFSLATPDAQAWGVTTRPGAAGLGLTVALRVARAHGFDLELRRVPPRTEAWLLIPAAELNPEPA
jgi:signal transduction histidine kinase